MKKALFLFFALGSAACSSSSSTPSGHTGTKARGEGCSVDNDCHETTAICLADQKVCTGPLDKNVFTTECSSANVDTCSGYVCAALPQNQQGKSGVCTLDCSKNPCGDSATCISLPLQTGGSVKICLAKCATNADCNNGFICAKDPATGSNVCFVNQ